MPYDTLDTTDSIQKTILALTERGFDPMLVHNKEEALAKIKELIPQGASVTNGSSRTLEEIGFVDYLKAGTHGWNNLHDAVLAEKDSQKQSRLRKESTIADVYLGSVHALSEDGDIVIASASGSQLPSIVFNAQNIIFVVSTQKITPTLDEALKRLREYVFPLEDARVKATGAPGSVMAKILIYEHEPAFMGRKVRVLLVNEKLGF
ncbi:MAG: lactate utilization protein [Patescibacteria group bacterium]